MKKILLIILLISISFSNDSFKNKLIKKSDFITYNIDRDWAYSVYSTMSMELESYIKDKYIYEVYDETGTRIELYKNKIKSNKIILVANGGSFINPYKQSRKEYILNVLGGYLNDFNIAIVDYKMGYKQRFPNLNKDFLNAYRFILKKGYNPGDISFFGDSSGGNIVAGSTIYLLDNKLPLPASIVLLSPYLDVTNKVESRKRNKSKDVFFGTNNTEKNGVKLQDYMPYFINVKDKSNKYISPIYANDLKGFPKTLIHVGSYEILEDDSAVFSQNLKKSGVDVIYKSFEELYHVFHIFNTTEGREATIQVAEFLKKNTGIKNEIVSLKDINRIKFNVTFDSYTEDEIDNMYKEINVDMKSFINIQEKTNEKYNRKYLNK